MEDISLSGNDTLQLYGRTITGMCQGDWGQLKYPNETVNLTVGKNGNTTYAYSFNGRQASFELRVLRGSDDDAFLQSQLSSQDQDFVSTTLAQGQFVKRIGDGQGNVQRDTHKLRNGVIAKRVEAKANAEGDTEQALSVYMFKFGKVQRVIM
jgi:hypothetical protein